MIIENSPVVIYKYITTWASEITGATDYEAEKNLEIWIENNTPYRGITQFLKHIGANKYYITENNKIYTYNTKWLEVDEFENVLREIDDKDVLINFF